MNSVEPRGEGEGVTAPNDDAALLERLRTGDEAAFLELVERYHASLLRLAMMFVHSREVAEEVVQDTWLGVLQGIERFEGRSSLRTWLFRILTNRAQTRGKREARSIPFSDLAGAESEGDEPAVEVDRFRKRWPFRDHWSNAPDSWETQPEERLVSKETLAQVEKAIETLPPAQAQVIRLRDIQQWSAEEVCNALGLTETNQRVLLHRARSKVRRALEQYLGVKR